MGQILAHGDSASMAPVRLVAGLDAEAEANDGGQGRAAYWRDHPGACLRARYGLRAVACPSADGYLSLTRRSVEVEAHRASGRTAWISLRT